MSPLGPPACQSHPSPAAVFCDKLDAHAFKSGPNSVQIARVWGSGAALEINDRLSGHPGRDCQFRLRNAQQGARSAGLGGNDRQGHKIDLSD